MMWRNRFLTVLLAVPLFCAGLSCNEKVVETGDAENLSGGHFDTRYIADDFVMAAVVHPARVYQSEIIQGVLTETKKLDDKGIIDQLIKRIIQEVGLDPRAVEQAILLVDVPTAVKFLDTEVGGKKSKKTRVRRKTRESKKILDSKKTEGEKFDDKTEKKEKEFDEKTASPVMFLAASTTTMGMRRSPIGAFPSLIVRFEKSPDQSAILKRLAGIFYPSWWRKSSRDGHVAPVPKFVESKHDGKTIHTLEPVAVCFPDDKTMLISTEVLLEKMLAVQEGKSILAKQLSHLGDRHDALFVANVSTVIPLTILLKGQPSKGSPAAKWASHLGKLKVISATAGLSSEQLLSVRLTTENKTAAKKLTAVLKTDEESAKMQSREIDRLDHLSEGLRRLLKQIFNARTVEQEGSDVLYRVARPKDLDKLPQLIASTWKLEKDRKEARLKRTAWQKNLKQIAIAFHNYHDAYNRFPSVSKGGLSWRVHLLPMLNQKELYKKFRLKEPWDSTHNKKLIQEMPDVFKRTGTKNNGKTSVHLFIGRQTIFFPGKRVTFGFITDGASNTLMTVEAGPDKAGFWTKPGGLPFDPEKDPKAELGKIGESFLMGLADGSVRRVPSTISSEALKALITRTGGKNEVSPWDWDSSESTPRETKRKEKKPDMGDLGSSQAIPKESGK